MSVKGSDVFIDGSARFQCDGASTPKTNFLIINGVNNRAPMFNEKNYVLKNVSKRLPKGLDLLKVYEIDLWIQDLDRSSNGQLNDIESITVLGMEIQFFMI